MSVMKHILCFVLILGLVFPSMTTTAQGEIMAAGTDCPVPESLSETVPVGVTYGVSGSIAVFGVPQRQGAELAVKHINEQNYLGEGVTLEMLFEDSGSDAEQAIAAMTKLVEEDQVVGVIGPTLSTQAFAADPIAEENGIPVLGTSNTASGITDMGEFVFRNSLPESSVIPGTIAGAKDILGLERVGVLFGNDDDFTVSGYEVFLEALEENGIEVTAEETFARDDSDFNAQLTNILATDPDAIVVSALAAEAIKIIIQARQLGYDGPIIGGNGLNTPAIAEQAGADAEGTYVGAAWNISSPDELSAAFTESFEEEFGARPDQFAAQAYTGVWLMATAIRCADSMDSGDVRDALAAIRDFPTPLGLFSFDENRNPVHAPVVQVIQDGVYAVVDTGIVEESEE